MSDQFGIPMVDCRPTHEVITELRQQVTQLRDALTKERDLRVFGQSVECGKIHWESIRDMRRDVYKGTEEALAATDDLKEQGK